MEFESKHFYFLRLLLLLGGRPSVSCTCPTKSDTLGESDEAVPTELFLAHSIWDCTWYHQLLPAVGSEHSTSWSTPPSPLQNPGLKNKQKKKKVSIPSLSQGIASI